MARNGMMGRIGGVVFYTMYIILFSIVCEIGMTVWVVVRRWDEVHRDMVNDIL